MASSLASPTTNKCILCGSPGKACASCSSTHYCSQECQTTDWPLHKHLCKKIKKFDPRPSATSTLGFRFPLDSTAPELLWVELESELRETEDEPSEHPFVSPYLGPWDGGEIRFDRTIVNRNDYRSTTVDHAIVIYSRDALQEGLVANDAVVDATKGKAAHDWKGPVLVLSQDGDPQHPHPTRRDVTLSDLRNVVDYFMLYGPQDPLSQDDAAEPAKVDEKFAKLRAESRPRKGFRLNCEGDVGLLKNKYSDVHVQRDHPIYSQAPTSVTKVMGMPLLVHQYPPSKAWKNKRASHDNASATFLCADAEVSSSNFGLAPAKWQSHVGSVLVVREDGKDIDAKQGFAIAEFCREYLQPKFEYAMEMRDRKARATVAQDYICRDAFEKYLERFKREMMQSWDPDAKTWKDVVSPY